MPSAAASRRMTRGLSTVGMKAASTRCVESSPTTLTKTSAVQANSTPKLTPSTVSAAGKRVTTAGATSVIANTSTRNVKGPSITRTLSCAVRTRFGPEWEARKPSVVRTGATMQRGMEIHLCLSVCLSVGRSVGLSVGRSVGRSVSQSVSLSICLSVCLSVCAHHQRERRGREGREREGKGVLLGSGVNLNSPQLIH